MKKRKSKLESIVISLCLGLAIPGATATAAKKCEFEPSPPLDPSKKAGEYVWGWKTKTKDQIYHFIPKEAYEKGEVQGADVTGDYIPDIYWWDKNKDEDMTDDELFYDLNSDGIIDINRNQLKYKERDV